MKAQQAIEGLIERWPAPSILVREFGLALVQEVECIDDLAPVFYEDFEDFLSNFREFQVGKFAEQVGIRSSPNPSRATTPKQNKQGSSGTVDAHPKKTHVRVPLTSSEFVCRTLRLLKKLAVVSYDVPDKISDITGSVPAILFKRAKERRQRYEDLENLLTTKHIAHMEESNRSTARHLPSARDDRTSKNDLISTKAAMQQNVAAVEFEQIQQEMSELSKCAEDELLDTETYRDFEIIQWEQKVLDWWKSDRCTPLSLEGQMLYFESLGVMQYALLTLFSNVWNSSRLQSSAPQENDGQVNASQSKQAPQKHSVSKKRKLMIGNVRIIRREITWTSLVEYLADCSSMSVGTSSNVVVKKRQTGGGDGNENGNIGSSENSMVFKAPLIQMCKPMMRATHILYWSERQTILTVSNSRRGVCSVYFVAADKMHLDRTLELPRKFGQVTNVALCPLYSYIVCAFFDGVRLFDSDNFVCKAFFKEQDAVTVLQWMPGIKRLATGSRMGRCRLYDLGQVDRNFFATNQICTDSPFVALSPHDEAVSHILPSTVNHSVVSSAMDGNLVFSHAENGSVLKVLSGAISLGMCLVDHLGLIVSYGVEPWPMVWAFNVADAKPQFLGAKSGTKAHEGRIVQIQALRTPRNAVASMDRVGILKIWDVWEFSCLQTIDFKDNAPGGRFLVFPMFAYDHVARRIITGVKHDVFISNFHNDGDERNTKMASKEPVKCMCYCSNTNILLLATRRSIVYWNVVTSSPMHTVNVGQITNGEVTNMLVDEESEQLFVGTTKGEILTLNIGNGTTKQAFEHPSRSAITTMKYLKEVDMLLACAGSHSVCVTADDVKEFLVSTTTTVSASCFVYHAALELLLIGEADTGVVSVWDLEERSTGQLAWTCVTRCASERSDVHVAGVVDCYGTNYFMAYDTVGVCQLWLLEVSHGDRKMKNSRRSLMTRTVDKSFRDASDLSSTFSSSPYQAHLEKTWVHRTFGTTYACHITGCAYEPSYRFLYVGDSDGYVTVYDICRVLHRQVPFPSTGQDTFDDFSHPAVGEHRSSLYQGTHEELSAPSKGQLSGGNHVKRPNRQSVVEIVEKVIPTKGTKAKASLFDYLPTTSEDQEHRSTSKSVHTHVEAGNTTIPAPLSIPVLKEEISVLHRTPVELDLLLRSQRPRGELLHDSIREVRDLNDPKFATEFNTAGDNAPDVFRVCVRKLHDEITCLSILVARGATCVLTSGKDCNVLASSMFLREMVGRFAVGEAARVTIFSTQKESRLQMTTKNTSSKGRKVDEDGVSCHDDIPFPYNKHRHMSSKLPPEPREEEEPVVCSDVLIFVPMDDDDEGDGSGSYGGTASQSGTFGRQAFMTAQDDEEEGDSPRNSLKKSATFVRMANKLRRKTIQTKSVEVEREEVVEREKEKLSVIQQAGIYHGWLMGRQEVLKQAAQYAPTNRSIKDEVALLQEIHHVTLEETVDGHIRKKLGFASDKPPISQNTRQSIVVPLPDIYQKPDSRTQEPSPTTSPKRRYGSPSIRKRTSPNRNAVKEFLASLDPRLNPDERKGRKRVVEETAEVMQSDALVRFREDLMSSDDDEETMIVDLKKPTTLSEMQRLLSLPVPPGEDIAYPLSKDLADAGTHIPVDVIAESRKELKRQSALSSIGKRKVELAWVAKGSTADLRAPPLKQHTNWGIIHEAEVIQAQHEFKTELHRVSQLTSFEKSVEEMTIEKMPKKKYFSSLQNNITEVEAWRKTLVPVIEPKKQELPLRWENVSQMEHSEHSPIKLARSTGGKCTTAKRSQYSPVNRTSDNRSRSGAASSMGLREFLRQEKVELVGDENEVEPMISIPSTDAEQGAENTIIFVKRKHDIPMVKSVPLSTAHKAPMQTLVSSMPSIHPITKPNLKRIPKKLKPTTQTK